MLAKILGELGHDVRVAHDGRRALATVEAWTPDVALLDIGLPDIDGYELARRLAALPGLAELRTIAVTGYGQDSDREKSRAAGFTEHLVKPVEIDVLRACLAPILGRARGAAQPD